MPKMKTKSALTKRIRKTGSSKIKRKKAFKSHLAYGKSTKQKRHLGKSTVIDKSDMKRIKGLL